MILSHLPSIRWLSLLAVVAAISGCASIGSSSEKQGGHIKITSEPARAVAYADGAELGTTPLEIVPSTHFHSGFVGLSYRYIGKLMIKKAGCETWSTEVNDYLLSKDIHAKLKCDPGYRPPVAAPAPVTQAVTPVDKYTERLERIEDLRRKGLINNEEYQNLRKRILDEL